MPLVDAGMRELLATGYLSYRCRQNCASLLAKDLRLDWRSGAELFQWLLVDHDVGSNWGNWRYFSGVGSDPKQRHFRTISQGLRYDPGAVFIKKWLPQLAACQSARDAHLTPFSNAQDLGVVVDPITQLTWMDLKEVFPDSDLVNAS